MAIPVTFDIPRIGIGATPEDNIRDLSKYVYQLTEKLNYAMSIIDTPEAEEAYVKEVTGAGATTDAEAKARDVFNQIKNLIISSADIVEAYYEQMSIRIAGSYVAKSDFGVYAEETAAEIEANSTAISQNFSLIQAINGAVTEIMNMQAATRAWVRSGLLDDTVTPPVYGVEVGQVTTVDDQEVFNKFARFTAGGIYFYLPGTSATEPVASLTGIVLRVTNVQILARLNIGGYVINSNNGLMFKWGGR
jgi:hypothetical protein